MRPLPASQLVPLAATALLAGVEDLVRAAFHDNDERRPSEHCVYYAVLREPGDD